MQLQFNSSNCLTKRPLKMPQRILTTLICLISLWALLFPNIARSSHGVSIDGILKYPPSFKHFDYTSTTAREGGDLVLHDLGSFDKMNPYTLKGTAAAGLSAFIFEPLAISSHDEPFAKYGLIAKDINVADNGLSVTFTLNPKARFSDGTPITVNDILFSLDTLKSEAAHPFYQSYFNDITHAEIIDSQTIRFFFAKKNRELHLIACELPVLSKQFFSKHPFNEPNLSAPIGSGPYIIETIDPGKSITYRKNPDYWGKEHPTRKNMFNFSTITYKYYKDQLVAVEAFKAGDFDFMPVNIAKQWARDLVGQKFDSKQILKEYLDHKNNAGMQCFVMNIRKPLLASRNVRQAIGLAFDFEWTNKTLFFGQYTQTNSYFSNSPLAAQGLPSGLELEYLLPFKDTLPPEVFTQPLTPVSTTAPDTLRKNLVRAKQLLSADGWTLNNGVLVNRSDPKLAFKFEILLASPSFERVMEPFVRNLEKLGIQATYRTIDPALYTRRLNDFDFDMVVTTFAQSQSPGNEQRSYWYSTSAGQKGSRNLIGLKDPVVDTLVDRIIYATKQTELEAACKALDRALWYGYYVVPNWYIARHRVSYWNKFQKPKTLPLYYQPDDALMTWWISGQ